MSAVSGTGTGFEKHHPPEEAPERIIRAGETSGLKNLQFWKSKN
jgi:hypothetical protein